MTPFNVRCVSNSGFEDQITVEKVYRVHELGENSYLICTDSPCPEVSGRPRWFGRQHFVLEQD